VCGIAGRFDPAATCSADELAEQVAAMTATLTHRGPDAEGIWADPESGVCFGHRRLAVLGLGPEGAQPMASSAGRWVVSYNGEIYNHPELRRRLEAEGATFRGGSDTEVLLAALTLWGLDRTLEAIEGMFALALWDRHERCLHLVRDRFGEKPLFYGWVAGVFAFGSELKALAALPGFAPGVDRDAVALYLRHNCVPAPWTIYRGIAKVLPGEVVRISAGDRSGSEPARRHFWSARDAIEAARRDPISGSHEEMADELERAVSASVAARMVADVPVGAFLSGGIDSSLIVALMQQHSSVPVRTYTIGYADEVFDESKEAAAVAAHLGTEHTSLEVTRDQAGDVVARVPDIWDEPFGDVSGIPMALVSELARTDVTVALSGDGGDELFAGYNRHAWLGRIWGRAEGMPVPVRRATGSALGAVPPAWIDGAAKMAAKASPRFDVRIPSTKVAKVAKVLAAPGLEAAYLSLVSYWDHAEDMVIGAGPSASVASKPDEWPRLDGITEQMLWLDLVGYLPDDILTKLDRAAMATALESRVPFLDRGVFDVAWRLPLDVKLREGTTKWLVRQVLARHVPTELFDRPKMGFGFPIGDMLRGTLRPWAEELLGEHRLADQGLLDPAPIRRAWRDHLSGRRDHAYQLWAVLALQAWADRWASAGAL